MILIKIQIITASNYRGNRFYLLRNLLILSEVYFGQELFVTHRPLALN